MTTAPPTRVVVADDSGLMRRVLTHALSDAGFEVVGQAKDGDEALELCRRLRPDTMTLDLHMPGMDGIGVLRELKRPGAPSIPVIVVSAFSPAHGARAVDALSEGAFDLVAKPGAGDALSAFVAELSDKVRAAAGSLRRRIGRPVPAPAAKPAPPAPGRMGPISPARVCPKCATSFPETGQASFPRSREKASFPMTGYFSRARANCCTSFSSPAC